MDRLDHVRLGVARRLETGAWDGAVARILSSAWGAVSLRAIARPLVCPAGVKLVAVGGATLGGSGKTPLAIECARALGRHARVAFVAHGYRARAREPRIVRPDDDLAEVGDEALVASRALDGIAPVVVAGKRQAAVDHAARFADVLVLDGVLQTVPRRASLSLLALDPESPWGAGALPPRGDLRAPVASLVGACDQVITLQATSRGAHHDRRLLGWPELASRRLGLFVALARPGRVRASLARHGITPAHVVTLADHSLVPRGLGRRLGAARCDLWLASAKCATRLEGAGVPHAVLEHEVHLPPTLERALAALSHDAP